MKFNNVEFADYVICFFIVVMLDWQIAALHSTIAG